MKNSLLILSILLFFTACSPKISITTLQSSKVNNANIRQLAVVKFKNDAIGQTSSIEAQLANITFNQEPYFTLIQREELDLILKEKKLNDSALVDLDDLNDIRGLTQVKAFLMGEVVNSTMYKKVYFKRVQDFQRCLAYDKNKQCIQFPMILKRCQTNDYSVQTQIKVVEVITSDILFTQTYKENDTLSSCDGAFLPSKEQHNTYLANLIAKKISKDLAPHYQTKYVTLLDELDISVSDNQELQFENALALLKQERYVTANEILQQLNFETNEQSLVILYNLALSYEALNEIEKANKLYIKAEQKSLKIGVIEEISEAIVRTQKTMHEKELVKKLLNSN